MTDDTEAAEAIIEAQMQLFAEQIRRATAADVAICMVGNSRIGNAPPGVQAAMAIAEGLSLRDGQSLISTLLTASASESVRKFTNGECRLVIVTPTRTIEIPQALGDKTESTTQGA